MISFFVDDWKELQIEEHLNVFGVLIIFSIENYFFGKEAKMIVYGRLMSDYDKEELKEYISKQFGGEPITDEICIKINERAQRWYNKNILKKKARVLNAKRK